MPETATLHAGDSIVKMLTFTLAAGEEASCISLLLTRECAQSEHSTAGRVRCIVLEAEVLDESAPRRAIVAAAAVASPRGRFIAELQGVVPKSICGGTYVPVFCLFAYTDGRPTTAFEIDTDQRFMLHVADDASAVDAGPSISGFN